MCGGLIVQDSLKSSARSICPGAALAGIAAMRAAASTRFHNPDRHSILSKYNQTHTHRYKLNEYTVDDEVQSSLCCGVIYRGTFSKVSKHETTT